MTCQSLTFSGAQFCIIFDTFLMSYSFRKDTARIYMKFCVFWWHYRLERMEFDRFHRGVKSDLSIALYHRKIALYHRKIALYHRKIAVVEAEQCRSFDFMLEGAEQCRTFDFLCLWSLNSVELLTFYGCGGWVGLGQLCCSPAVPPSY